MNFISQGFKSVLGGQGENVDGPSGAETVYIYYVISLLSFYETDRKLVHVICIIGYDIFLLK